MYDKGFSALCQESWNRVGHGDAAVVCREFDGEPALRRRLLIHRAAVVLHGKRTVSSVKAVNPIVPEPALCGESQRATGVAQPEGRRDRSFGIDRWRTRAARGAHTLMMAPACLDALPLPAIGATGTPGKLGVVLGHCRV